MKPYIKQIFLSQFFTANIVYWKYPLKSIIVVITDTELKLLEEL